MKAFATHLVNDACDITQLGEPAPNWLEGWGTAGDFGGTAPFADTVADALPDCIQGQDQREKRLSAQPPDALFSALFRAVGDDAKIGALSFSQLHVVSMLRVPTPDEDFENHEEDVGDTADSTRVSLPTRGWVRQIEVLIMRILTTFVVRWPC